MSDNSIYRWVRKLFGIKKYRRLEIRFVSYSEGDKLIKESSGKPESERWVLALPEEDNNRVIGMVYLERKEQI